MIALTLNRIPVGTHPPLATEPHPISNKHIAEAPVHNSPDVAGFLLAEQLTCSRTKQTTTQLLKLAEVQQTNKRRFRAALLYGELRSRSEIGISNIHPGICGTSVE